MMMVVVLVREMVVTIMTEDDVADCGADADSEGEDYKQDGSDYGSGADHGGGGDRPWWQRSNLPQTSLRAHYTLDP